MSEEIALAAADLAELARLATEVRGLLAVVEQRDRALEAERVARASAEAHAAAFRAQVIAAGKLGGGGLYAIDKLLRTDHPGQALLTEPTAARETAESRLGTAQAEITRLEQAMRHAARMYTIKGARKIIAQALGDPAIEQSPRKR